MAHGPIWITVDRDGVFGRYSGTGWNDSVSGVIGGGQIGYNWQANNVFSGFVFGVEADFGGTGFSFNHHPFNNVLLNDDTNSGFYADVTGRLGYASGPALFYIKGGWAWFDGGLTLRDGGFAVPARLLDQHQRTQRVDLRRRRRVQVRSELEREG